MDLENDKSFYHYMVVTVSSYRAILPHKFSSRPYRFEDLYYI